MILFYVEFNNGDSNCYQGVRAPTLDEARVFCKEHMDSNPQWEDVAFVGEIDRAQAETLWDLSCLEGGEWPTFYSEDYVELDKNDRPFAYVCSPLRGDIEANMERAREYNRQVFEAGYCPITPHIYFPQFLNDDIPSEREAGMKMGESLLPFCRALVICGDTISEGMKREINTAQSLGIETCTLENIPPIPTLDNFRNDLSNLDNFGIAISLIEGMTGCRFTAGVGGVFIYPDSDAYLAVNMKNKWDYKTGLCRVTFDVNIRTMGHSMSADGVSKLQQEINRTQTLLSLLESREFVLTQDDMEKLFDSLRLRDPTKDVEKPSVMKKIAAAREQAADNAKRGRQSKGKDRGEEH